MSYGQSEKPCDSFKYWFGNGTLCGKCAWQRKDHANFPAIKEIVFALIFDTEIVGYKMWSSETCQWMYSDTYNRQSGWGYEPPKHAYSKIELAYMYPNITI